MSLFDDNITTHPLDSLNEISHKAVTSVIRDSKRWYILDEEWLKFAILCKIKAETDQWWGWEKAGALEGSIPMVHVKKLPYWRCRLFIGKPIFHIIIKAKISCTETMIRVFDKEM